MAIKNDPRIKKQETLKDGEIKFTSAFRDEIGDVIYIAGRFAQGWMVYTEYCDGSRKVRKECGSVRAALNWIESEKGFKKEAAA